MIFFEQIAEIAVIWKNRTPEEKAYILDRAKQLRTEAKSWPSFYSENARIFHELSEEVAKGLMGGVYGLDPDETLEESAWPAVELFILEALRSPKMLAWDRACKYLNEAIDDPVIRANPETAKLLESWMTLVSEHAEVHDTAESLNPPPEKIATQAISRRAAEVAGKKNADPRAWVLTEWESRPDLGQSKASFARQCVPLVKQRFGVLVTEDTIKRDWLPKSGK